MIPKGADDVIGERGNTIIRVEVRSQSPFARAGLETAVAADPRFEIASENDPESDELPDVILLDGLDTEIAINPEPLSTGRSSRFVLLSEGLDPAEFVRLTQFGLRAVLTRDSSTQEITAALDAAKQDLTVIAPEFLLQLLPAEPPQATDVGDDLLEPLTAREREVLTLLAEGAGNKEVAAKLAISENTAKFHVSSILGKLGATTRTEAVTRGYRLGLILI
jgi:DNA-binding NarL/FixJ family response regulator